MVPQILRQAGLAFAFASVLSAAAFFDPSEARAQEPPGTDARNQGAGVDLHGQLPAVPQGIEGEPLLSWAPPRLDRGWSLVTQLEYAKNPLALEVQADDGKGWQLLPVVGNLAGANLSARWSPLSRLGLAVTVPVFMAEVADPRQVQLSYDTDLALAVPDVRLAVPVGILGSEDGLGTGIGLGLVPYVTVPTRVGGPLLNGSKPSFGGLATLGLRGKAGSLVANLGMASVPVGEVLALPTAGPLVGTGSLSLGRSLGPLWSNLELRVLQSISNPANRDDLPYQTLDPRPSAELLLSAGGRFGRGYAAVGGGRHLTRAPGAAAFRGLATFAISGGGAAGPGRAPRLPMTFRVLNPEGAWVDGAAIVLDGVEVGRTDGSGTLVLDPPVRWKTLQVTARNFEPLQSEHTPGLRYPLELTLAWKPALLDAVVTDPEGKPVEVFLTASRILPDGTLAPPSPPARPGELALPPGTYRVQIDAEGQATQYREIVVPDNGAPPEIIQAIAVADQGNAALVLRITGPEGAPVVGARVLVDGVPVGVTADGGLLWVSGFAEGEHKVEIQHEAFTAAVMDMVLSPESAEVPTMLQRVPGTVRVVVRGPDGQPVKDAVIRYVGPSRLPPMAVGPQGERVDVLSPGDWVLVVSSGDYGVQERDIFIPPERYDLLTVDVQLRPVEVGSSELDLRVVDPAGSPVEGLVVRLDGTPIGTTSTGGTVRLTGLAPGPRQLQFQGAGIVEQEDLNLLLQPGVNAHLATVRWKPGTVDVVVRGPDGIVPDAAVRFLGPTETPATLIGNTGRLRTELGAGRWTAVVSSTQYGLQERDFVLEEGSGALTTLQFVLQPVEEGLADLLVRVVDPDGEPLPGARILLDDRDYGTTGNTGAVRLSSLAVGTRELRVAALGYIETRQDLKLLEGDQQVEIGLDFAQGAVKVRVRHQDQPVTDAVVRLFGPSMTPAAPVDADGEWLGVVEAPNELWMVVVTSPTLGIAEQDVLIRGTGLTLVDVAMYPPPPERTDLLVTVIDETRHAIEHARVLLDQKLVEQTEQGGTVLARGLEPGPALLQVEAPDFVTSPEIPIELRPGTVESFTIRLVWSTVDVEVRTFGPDGLPVDARVQWRDGPVDVAAQQSGEDGSVLTPLRPGSWHVYATRPSQQGGDLAAEAALQLELGDSPDPIELHLSLSGAAMAGNAVTIQEMVQFDFGEATLRPDSEVILTEVARVLKANPTLVKVQVEGHTDNVGSIEVNQALSQARAEAVRKALIERGVAPEILSAWGFASTRPLGDNETEEGRSKNRRVEFVITERGASLP